MKPWTDGRVSVVLIAALVAGVFTGGVALGEDTWVDQIAHSLTFYKASYPASNWAPYEQKLTAIQEALSRGDEETVKAETSTFVKMLQTREHGINTAAADELYNFALTVIPGEERKPVMTDPGMTTEQPMGVPEHFHQTPFPGGPPCKKMGCDYWEDDVYDPGAAG